MVQGRQRVQPANNTVHQTTLARLTGRISPQQSLKKVGPVISEVLRTSVRPKPQGNILTTSKGQKFRPQSEADAILCLDEGIDRECSDGSREPVSRTQQPHISGSSKSSIPPSRIAQRTAGGLGNNRTPSSCIPAPDKRVSTAPPPIKKNSVKIQLPGLLVNRQPNSVRGRRVSKALPCLPPPTPSPCKPSFTPPPKSSADVFQRNKGKVLRGQGPLANPVVCAPPMEAMSGSSEHSSGSSYDSAEQTWNMINNMMRAVGEEEITKARESLIRTNPKPTEVRAPRAYVTFPRTGPAGMDKDGWSSDCTLPKRTARTPSTDSSSTYCSTGLLDEYLQSEEAPWTPETSPKGRTTLPSFKRRGSVASSIFSVVIRPTRELSREEQEALIAEDDLPLRIRGILQQTHRERMPKYCSRTNSATSSEEAELHPDLTLTIDALRGICVEDVSFA